METKAIIIDSFNKDRAGVMAYILRTYHNDSLTLDPKAFMAELMRRMVSTEGQQRFEALMAEGYYNASMTPEVSCMYDLVDEIGEAMKSEFISRAFGHAVEEFNRQWARYSMGIAPRPVDPRPAYYNI